MRKPAPRYDLWRCGRNAYGVRRFGGSTMTEPIRLTREGAVAAITIDRGAEGNVLTTVMLRALTASIRAAAATDARVITLRTTGADFCRGRDPKGGPANPTALVMR